MYLSDPKPPRRISEVFNDVPVLPSPGSKMKPSSEYVLNASPWFRFDNRFPPDQTPKYRPSLDS